MPDWPREIRAAIASLELDPAREASLVEEQECGLLDFADHRFRPLLAQSF